MNEKDMEIIAAVNQKISIRPWTDGKMLLITRDENVKSEMMRFLDEGNGALELLTDPDFESVPEDMEGPMLVVADPRHMAIVYDLEDKKIKLAECVPEEVDGDE